ncbi:MAG: hypothetical protein QNJ19_16320 [Woeseiaceae bacterium]|nr:hypothetical protein [Woeseiaceae bacterium]
MNSLRRTLRFRAATLLLLVGACVQLVELTHQHDHGSVEETESCVTCIHLDGSSAGKPVPGDPLAESVWWTGTTAEPEEFLSGRTDYRLPVRAPPII